MAEKGPGASLKTKKRSHGAVVEGIRTGISKIEKGPKERLTGAKFYFNLESYLLSSAWWSLVRRWYFLTVL